MTYLYFILSILMVNVKVKVMHISTKEHLVNGDTYDKTDVIDYVRWQYINLTWIYFKSQDHEN